MDSNPYASSFLWPPADPPQPPFPTEQLDTYSNCSTQPMFSQNLMEWPSNQPMPKVPLPTLNTRAPLANGSKNRKDNNSKTSFKRHNSVATTSVGNPMAAPAFGGNSKLKRANSNLSMPFSWQPDPRNLALRRLDTENKDLREAMADLRQTHENTATFIISEVSSNTSNALQVATKKIVDENATSVAKIVQEAVNYCSQSCKTMVDELEKRVGTVEDCVATLKPLAAQTLEIVSSLKSQVTAMQDKADERGSEIAERCEAMIQNGFDGISQHLVSMRSDNEHSDQQLKQFFEQQLNTKLFLQDVAESPSSASGELDAASRSSSPVSQSILAPRESEAEAIDDDYDLETSMFAVKEVAAPATNAARRQVLIEGLDLTVGY